MGTCARQLASAAQLAEIAVGSSLRNGDEQLCAEYSKPRVAPRRWSQTWVRTVALLSRIRHCFGFLVPTRTLHKRNAWLAKSAFCAGMAKTVGLALASLLAREARCPPLV